MASVDGRGSSDHTRLPSGVYAGSDAYDHVIEGQFPLIWLFPSMHGWDFFHVIVCLRGEGFAKISFYAPSSHGSHGGFGAVG